MIEKGKQQPVKVQIYNPKTPEEDRKIGNKNYHSLKWRERLDGLKKLASVNGDKVCVTSTVCPTHKTHYLIVVKRNGTPLSEPMCPIVAAIRKTRLALGMKHKLDDSIFDRILELAAIKE